MRPVRVLFIGGWGRSGSTLLDRILGTSLGFFPAGEMREIWYRGRIENRLCGCGRGFHDCTFWKQVGELAFGGWDSEDAEERAAQRMRLDRPWHLPLLLRPSLSRPYRTRLADHTAALSRLYAAVRDISESPVIVDSSKIPTYAMLLRHVPGVDLRIVHLVRDPRGVAYSWQKSVRRIDGGGNDEMYRYGLGSTILRYDTYNVLTQTAARWGTAYMRVRYEDLVAAPMPVVERIARFAWESTVLYPGDLHAGKVEFGAGDHTVDGNPIRFQRGTIPLRLDDQWRTELNARTKRFVAAGTAPLVLHYRYPWR